MAWTIVFIYESIRPVEQKNMLKCFALKMNVTPVYKTDRALEETLDNLVKISSEKELKIILFEILGIISSDSAFDDSKKDFVKYMDERCNMNLGLVDKMIELFNAYANIFQEIVDVVL